MTKLDKEMKIWEDRANDEFGTILKALRDLTNDYFAGVNPLSNALAEYALDGLRKPVYNYVKNLLDNWDITDNDEGVDNLLKDLKKTF